MDGFFVPFLALAALMGRLRRGHVAAVLIVGLVSTGFAMSQVPDYVLDHDEHFPSGETPMTYHAADYAAATWIPRGPLIAGSEPSVEIVGGYGAHVTIYNSSIYTGEWTPQWKMFVIRSDDHRLTTTLPVTQTTANGFNLRIQRAYEADPRVVRVYDAGSVEILYHQGLDVITVPPKAS